MRHQWVIDVLQDIESYAAVNDLPQLSSRIAEVLIEARAEIAAQLDPAAGDSGDPDPPLPRPPRQTH